MVQLLIIELFQILILVSFIIAKSRFVPLKEKLHTISKLELQIALIASRLKVKILDETELNIKNIYFWTDSKTVLKYICNENRSFPVYIIHRLSEIRTNSNIKDWHFISGALNVSDHCTRLLKFEDLAKPNNFLNGPKFLFEPLHSDFSEYDIVLEEDEVVHNNLEITSNRVMVKKNSNCYRDCYSPRQNLVRYIAYVKLMIRNWKIKKNKPKESLPFMLNAEILYESQHTILELVQKDHFSGKHHNFKSDSPLKTK